MTLPTNPAELETKRGTFFRALFGPSEGFVNIAIRPGGKWIEHTFHYPDELPNMLKVIQDNYKQGSVWFCPQLLKSKQIPAGQHSTRVKDNVESCPVAWADLDKCDPKLCIVPPSFTIESSPERWQAYWTFRDPIDPEQAELICKNIAYHHVPDGADKTGWDLTQLLRVPYTLNFKYENLPPVMVRHASRTMYQVDDFKPYMESRVSVRMQEFTPMPQLLPTEAPLDLLQRYRRSLNPIVFSLFSVQPSTGPESDWSKIMWQLIMLCYEAGLSREEVFVVASEAACNKYKRDGKHPRLLWEEVCRGQNVTEEKFNAVVPRKEDRQPIITDAELKSIEGVETYIERYVKWAAGLGDAAPQYHHAAAFMSLSAILAGAIRLPTSFGIITPNMWFMILADTTLTRKSTAMDLGMELVDEVDSDILLATDGSLEGLLTAIEARPGRPAVFLRDEFSGLLESMQKKDYYAGMAETLTKLYDCKTMKRVLRKETITVRDPCLLMFAGGIKNRVQSLLTLEHVSSGFVPRFVFITAESDVTKLRPLGPPTTLDSSGRSKLVAELQEMRERYVHDQITTHRGKTVGIQTTKVEATLTEAAWERYNIFETTMLYSGINANQPDVMTPVYDRLAKSTLKAAILIAASRQLTGEVVVGLEDLLVALRYANEWREYTLEVIEGIGRTSNEALLNRMYKTIKVHPGVARSRLMQWYHLGSREAEVIFATLEQRGLISGTRIGKTTVYTALGENL